MKIIKKSHNKEAVSAVIGVILMVAITVAMTAAVFIYLNNMLGETDIVTPDIIVYKEITGEKGIKVARADFGILWDDIIVDHGTKPTGIEVAAGDFIPFTGDESVDVMSMTYGPTNTLIGTWKFGTFNGTGGGTTPTPTTPPVVTQVSSSDSGFSGVQSGDLLVVMPNTRTGTFSTDALTCTASGYTMVEVAAYMDDTGDRRAVAVLIRTATGSESGTVSVTWGGSGVSTYTTIYQVYRGATTWTDNGESDVQHNGGGSSSTSLPTIGGLSSSTTANVLTIGAAVFRDPPGTVTMTNLASQDSSDSNNCFTFTEFSYGDAVTDTDISWTTARLASGLLLQIECTD